MRRTTARMIALCIVACVALGISAPVASAKGHPVNCHKHPELC